MKERTRALRTLSWVTLIIMIGVLGIWIIRPDSERRTQNKEDQVQVPIGEAETLTTIGSPKKLDEKLVVIDEVMARELITFYSGMKLTTAMEAKELEGSAKIEQSCASFGFRWHISPTEIPTLLQSIRQKWAEPIEGSTGGKPGYNFSEIQAPVNYPGVLELSAETWHLEANGGGGGWLPVPSMLNRSLGLPESDTIRDYHVRWLLCPVTGYISLQAFRWDD